MSDPGTESTIAWIIEALSDSRVDALAFVRAIKASGAPSPDVHELLSRLEDALGGAGVQVDLAEVLRTMRPPGAPGGVGSARLGAARPVRWIESEASPPAQRNAVPDIIYWVTPQSDAAFSIRKRDGWAKLSYNLETKLVHQLVQAGGRPVPVAQIRALAASANWNKAEIVRRANAQLRGDFNEKWIDSIGRGIERAYYFWTPHGRRLERLDVPSLDRIDDELQARFGG